MDELEKISGITAKNLDTLQELDTISKKLGTLEEKLFSHISRFKLPR